MTPSERVSFVGVTGNSFVGISSPHLVKYLYSILFCPNLSESPESPEFQNISFFVQTFQNLVPDKKKSKVKSIHMLVCRERAFFENRQLEEGWVQLKSIGVY